MESTPSIRDRSYSHIGDSIGARKGRGDGSRTSNYSTLNKTPIVDKEYQLKRQEQLQMLRTKTQNTLIKQIEFHKEQIKKHEEAIDLLEKSVNRMDQRGMNSY